nr:GDNF family receptor alpha-3 [Pogona vitticeps]
MTGTLSMRMVTMLSNHNLEQKQHSHTHPDTGRGFLVLAFEHSNNCITAENNCVADSACNASYQILQNCSQSFAKSSFFLLHHEARDRCLEAEKFIQTSYFKDCKCHRRTRKQEEQCLRIYWTVHSASTQADFHLEVSPYEDVVDEEPSKTRYKHLETQLSGSRVFVDTTNPCLQAVNVCQLNHKCMRLRSNYAQICSAGQPCDQRKCHRNLRHFFERVSMDFIRPLLFCPCQDEICGERRWNTIVPECSFQSTSKPNCLVLLDSCLKDNICKSRLADFQKQCKPSSTSSDGCSLKHSHAACLEAYMGMIGTAMTPNYISNSSDEVTLWCSCTKSGNQKEDCDQILESFANNRCLRSAIQSQMRLNQVTRVLNEKVPRVLQLTPSLDIQADGTSTSTVFSAKMSQQPGENKKLVEHQKAFPNPIDSGAWLSAPLLTLMVLLLLLG